MTRQSNEANILKKMNKREIQSGQGQQKDEIRKGQIHGIQKSTCGQQCYYHFCVIL